MKMYFYYQIKRAERKARQKWYIFYSVDRYGAPGRLEFICPNTGMVAKTINQEEAVTYRVYWRKCANKSREILGWLSSIDESCYTAEVHSYLSRLLIVGPPMMREVAIYEKEHPFVSGKPWQELFVNFMSVKFATSMDGP